MLFYQVNLLQTQIVLSSKYHLVQFCERDIMMSEKHAVTKSKQIRIYIKNRMNSIVIQQLIKQHKTGLPVTESEL